jgi:hypothetical protein
MLAGLAVPLPLETETLRPVRCRPAPGGHLSRSHLAARGVDKLHPLPLRRCRAAEGLRGKPGRLQLRTLWDKLDAAHLPEQLGELSLPTPSLPAEDHLQRLALALVGPFVDEQPQRRLGFSGSRIALEGGEHDEAQAVQPDVAVVSLEDALLLDYRHIHTELARPYRGI